MSEKELEACKRCEYASELLKKENIPHEIKKREIGHINLLNSKGRVVMSFWARTGKFIFTQSPTKENTNNFNDRGIKNCINLYNQNFKENVELVIK